MPSRSRAEARHRAVRRSPLIWGALWLVLGCEADREVVEVALELQVAPSCTLSGPVRLELRALGDFRAQRAEFAVEAATATFDQFPIGTREIAIEGEFEPATLASGRVAVTAPRPGPGAPLPIVLLPERESCPLGDPLLFPGDGAAVVPLPDGGFMMAGGTGPDGRVRSSAVVLRPGRTLVEEVADGMLLRRRDASATLAGDLILVAGGARESRGNAEDNYEVYDVQLGLFARERSDRLSAGSRMEHGAARLPDGSVLLVGGRSEPAGAPLATAQLIRLEAPAPDPLGDLNTARIAPQLLVLDSGAVIVAGGSDQDGAVVTTLERFEAAAGRFVTLDLRLPAFEGAISVALPGGRLAWLGCDTRVRAVCGLTLVLLRGDEPIAIEVPLAWGEVAPRGLVELRAIALEDGRLLVTGREPDGAMQSRALVADLDERVLEAISATRAPTNLVRLDDGALAELDRVGASLRRLGSVSRYDSPEGDLMADAPPGVLLDAAERWERAGDGLRALVGGARVDVPRLSLGSFRAELSLRGPALVRLSALATSDARAAPELAIPLGSSEPAADGCRGFAPAGPIVLERRGSSIRISAEGEGACELTWPTSALAGFALEAEADTLLRGLSLTRL